MKKLIVIGEKKQVGLTMIDFNNINKAFLKMLLGYHVYKPGPGCSKAG